MSDRKGRRLHNCPQGQPANAPRSGQAEIGKHLRPFQQPDSADRFVNERDTRLVTIEPDAANFPHAAQLINVQRWRSHKHTGQKTTGTRYLVTSHPTQPALTARLSRQIRGYWGAENIVHWRRGVIEGED